MPAERLTMSTALVLFRRDLRLADNPAWHAACAGHAQVLPVFILKTNFLPPKNADT